MVYGGQITEGLLGDLYVLNLNTLEWKRGPSSTDGRVGMACTIYDDGFLVWGGNFFVPILFLSSFFSLPLTWLTFVYPLDLDRRCQGYVSAEYLQLGARGVQLIDPAMDVHLQNDDPT